MEKNWLIRTKSNHILGPVSKEKALELYNNGSIKGDDELCTGNGYWFYIREDDLIERFLKGNEVQGFNPISEAKDVLTHSNTNVHSLEKSQDENTLVGNVNLSQLKKKEGQGDVTPIRPQSALSHVTDPNPKKKSNQAPVEKIPTPPREKKVHKSQSFLQYLVIAGFLILFCLIYFRKNLFQLFGHASEGITSSLISTAHAQEEGADLKKKSF